MEKRYDQRSHGGPNDDDMGKILGPVRTTKDARAVIEEIARRKGFFSDAFRREAEEEAENGRKGMLQAIESSEENREDLAKALKMCVLCSDPP